MVATLHLHDEATQKEATCKDFWPIGNQTNQFIGRNITCVRFGQKHSVQDDRRCLMDRPRRPPPSSPPRSPPSSPPKSPASSPPTSPRTNTSTWQRVAQPGAGTTAHPQQQLLGQRNNTAVHTNQQQNNASSSSTSRSNTPNNNNKGPNNNSTSEKGGKLILHKRKWSHSETNLNQLTTGEESAPPSRIATTPPATSTSASKTSTSPPKREKGKEKQPDQSGVDDIINPPNNKITTIPKKDAISTSQRMKKLLHISRKNKPAVNHTLHTTTAPSDVDDPKKRGLRRSSSMPVIPPINDVDRNTSPSSSPPSHQEEELASGSSSSAPTSSDLTEFVQKCTLSELRGRLQEIKVQMKAQGESFRLMSVLETQNNRGRTPLMSAVEAANAAIVEFLVKKKVNVNTTDPNGMVLHYKNGWVIKQILQPSIFKRSYTYIHYIQYTSSRRVSSINPQQHFFIHYTSHSSQSITNIAPNSLCISSNEDYH